MNPIPPSLRYAAVATVIATGVRAAPTWVRKSNADAQVLLQTLGKLEPERASSYGLREYDPLVSDAGPGADQRLASALGKARERLQKELEGESDARVRSDLRIMIHAVEIQVEGIALDRRYLLPYTSVARRIFQGEFILLNPGASPDRHAAAVARLRRYAGLLPGAKPFTELARAETMERLADSKLLGPYRREVEQELANTSRYIDGVRGLLAKNHLDAPDAIAALTNQLAAYDRWVRQVILPRCRTDFRVPPDVYAHDLRAVGIDIPSNRLIAEAELEFAEVQSEMESLAPLVAREHGWKAAGYRAVIRRLKQDQLKPEDTESYYKQVVIPRVERLIREHEVVTLPNRPMAMRIASVAESAVEPAPHMQPPPLIDNHGERGTFVLTLGNPPSGKGASDVYDDFTFPAAAWTLVAHEGRPGHETQFDRMVEGGVSYARAIFAFNSVNVEGWALYCETEMKPYEPLDAQLIVLQYRLLRAARAFCDPMLNLGRMTREQVHGILVNDVCLSEAFAREELDRFTFRMPGQATSYFYGFSRLMSLRTETEVALGSRFDRLAFNDFIVDQGLLPPDLLARAVETMFIPEYLHQARTVESENRSGKPGN